MAYEATLQTLVGILFVSFFSFMGMRYIDDKRLKMIAFGTGIASAAVFAGLDVEDLFSRGDEYFSEHADTAGVATGTTTVLLSTLSPIKSLRNTGLVAGFTGIITGLFGNPSWIGFVVWIAILSILAVLIYKLIQKIGNAWKYKKWSWESDYHDHAN